MTSIYIVIFRYLLNKYSEAKAFVPDSGRQKTITEDMIAFVQKWRSLQ